MSGVKQHPLLHLMYALVPNLAGRTGRKVRATWLAPVVSKPKKRKRKTSKQEPTIRYDFKTITDKKANTEVQELVGMFLAQRVWTLPLWALQSRANQESLAVFIKNILYATDTDFAGNEDEYVPITSLWQQFAGVAKEGENTLAARAVAKRISERIAVLDRIASEPNARSAEFQQNLREQIALHRASALESQERKTVVLSSQQTFDAYRSRRIAALQLERTQAANAPASSAREMARRLSGYDDDISEFQELTASNFAQECDDVSSESLHVAHLLGEMSSQLRFGTAEAERQLSLPLLQEWQKRVEAYRIEEIGNATQIREQITEAAIENDYALQKANYDPAFHGFVDALVEAVKNPVARYIFLSLHPKLKYEWTAPTMCRIVKLLTDRDFLETWANLYGRNLIAPGPHARLGVTVMNALRPGSYDQRHRQLVQWEIEELVTTMKEFGISDHVSCHSCGAIEFRDPGKSGWIRDHNPPTALASLYFEKRIDLGLPFYAAADKQILLPQCLACSTAQSSIVNRVGELLASGGYGPLKDPGDLREWLYSELSDNEWEAFTRLVLNPGIGWSKEVQNGEEVTFDIWGVALVSISSFQDARLITTGVAGSFSGVDDNFLEEVGDLLGCHTCIDTPRQTDAYRGISWIADHQPPTSLVERGLAELPQIVHPHCHKCSKTQSALTRRLVGMFDGCFGKGWADQWIEEIKSLRFGDIG